MRLLGQTLTQRASEYPITLKNWAQWKNMSGFRGNATSISVVWACIDKAIEHIIPMPQYVLDGKRKLPVPLWVDKPNTFWKFRNQLISASVYSMWDAGNLFFKPITGSDGSVVELEIPDPRRFTISRTSESTIPQWRFDGQQPDFDFLHMPYVTRPGRVLGLGPVDACRLSLEIGDQSQQFLLRHFSQGATLQYVLTTPGKLGTVALENIKATWAANHQGAANAWRPMIVGWRV